MDVDAAWIVGVTPACDRLVLGGVSKYCRVLNVKDGKKLLEIKALEDRFIRFNNRATFSSDGAQMAWYSQSEGAVRVVELASGKLQQHFRADMGQYAAFSRDGKFLVTDTNDGTALVWDLTKIPRVEQAPLPK